MVCDPVEFIRQNNQDVSEEPAACVFRVQDSNAEREGSMLLQNNRAYVPNDTASSVYIHILINNNNKFNIANNITCNKLTLGVWNHVPTKHWRPSTRLHGAINEKTKTNNKYCLHCYRMQNMLPYKDRIMTLEISFTSWR